MSGAGPGSPRDRAPPMVLHFHGQYFLFTGAWFPVFMFLVLALCRVSCICRFLVFIKLENILVIPLNILSPPSLPPWSLPSHGRRLSSRRRSYVMFRLFSTAVFKVTRALLSAPLIPTRILTTDSVVLVCTSSSQRAHLSQVSTHHGQSFLVSTWNPVVTSRCPFPPAVSFLGQF